MPKQALYQPQTPVQSGVLVFSTESGAVRLNTGVPTEITEEQLSYLQENNEEWQVCLRQSLIVIQEVPEQESTLSDTKVMVTGETPQDQQPKTEPTTNPTSGKTTTKK